MTGVGLELKKKCTNNRLRHWLYIS